MTRHKLHHVRTLPDGRHRVFVDYKYYGTYKDIDVATRTADGIVLAREMESDDLIGKWPLNHPDEHDPPTLRRIKNAMERGDWHQLYGQYLEDEHLAETITPMPKDVVEKTNERKQIERFTKKWNKFYAGEDDAERVLPNGLSDWLLLAEQNAWDMTETMVAFNNLAEASR
jgi:hypothetical protein